MGSFRLPVIPYLESNPYLPVHGATMTIKESLVMSIVIVKAFSRQKLPSVSVLGANGVKM